MANVDKNSSYVTCEFGPTNYALFKTAYEYIDQWAEMYPERDAYIFRPSEHVRETISYEDLKTATEKYAVWFFREFGLKKGDRVAILCENKLCYALCELALGRLGVVTVRLYTTLNTVKYIESALEVNECSKILTQKKFISVLSKVGNFHDFQVLLIEGEDADLKVVPNHNQVDATNEELENVRKITKELSLEDDCTVYGTSGSTGEPKFVVLSHGAYINYMPQYLLKCGLRAGDRLFNDRPMAHVGGSIALGLPLGATIVKLCPTKTVSHSDSEFLAQVLREEKVNCGLFWPYLLYDMVKGGVDFSGLELKFVFCAGQIINHKILCQVSEIIKTPIGNLFGTTENGEICGTSLDDPLDVISSTVGHVMPGVQVKIVHLETREIIPRGEVGLLAVKKSYKWRYTGKNLPEDVNDEDGYFYTGDTAVIRPDGRIQIMGRRDDVINLGTLKYYPVEIERVIYQLESVDKVIVFGVPDERMGQLIGAAILPKTGYVTRRDDVMKLFHENRYLEPKYVWIEQSFPLNSSGKLDSKAIKKNCLEKLSSYRKFADNIMEDM